MNDNVVPFGRREPADAPRRPGALPDSALHPRTRRAQPQARAVAAEQATEDRHRYMAARTRQENEALIASGKVVPARITIALDIRELDGPEVDEQCDTWDGNPAGDVDRWELALAVPSPDQVRLLAELTDFPEVWFYLPIEPGPLPGDGPVWLCGRRGCEALQPNVVDERGVLLYEGKPRTLPDSVQGELFSGGPRPERERVRPKEPLPSRKKTLAKKATPPPAGQPALPTRMPEELRVALAAKGVLKDRRR